MSPHLTVPSPLVALAGWCALSPTGAQTTQLLVEPRWRPAVLWDRVTLTCQGSGTAGATTWYKDGQRWGQQGHDHITVTESGTYTCDRPGSGHSRHVKVLDDQLVLQVPTRTLLEGDTVTLRCQCRQGNPVSSVFFYHEEKELVEFQNGTELFLSHLQLHHSGRYRCRGWVNSRVLFPRNWGSPAPPAPISCPEPFPVPVLEVPPEPTEGSPLTLSSPLLHVFYRDGQVVGVPQGSPQLLVPAVGVSHSGNYSCEVRSEGGAVQKSSAWLRIMVRMPVANATITLSPLAHQVRAGDPVTLRCSVQVGSAPVTFTWRHNGQEVAQGPLLELGDVNVGHSGTYQCVATNQLDSHQALSPELVLTVTSQGHMDPGEVTQGHQGVHDSWGDGHESPFTPTPQLSIPSHTSLYPHRPSPEPLATPEEGEILYTHVVSTKQAQRENGGGGGERDSDMSPSGVIPHLGPHNLCLLQGPLASPFTKNAR
uniref:Ig-like domain-containing protein n=1 Tax=Taeniopygia guttata TaxID=59729 RepID=A0A674HKI8_TAEGU